MLHPRNRITRQRFASKHSRLSYSNRIVLIDLEMSKFPTSPPPPLPSPASSKFAIKCFSPFLQWREKSMAIYRLFSKRSFFMPRLFFPANNLNWIGKNWNKFERIDKIIFKFENTDLFDNVWYRIFMILMKLWQFGWISNNMEIHLIYLKF